MQVRVRYVFEGRAHDYLTNPFGNGVYNTVADYRAEMHRYFPDAIVEEVVENLKLQEE